MHSPDQLTALEHPFAPHDMAAAVLISQGDLKPKQLSPSSTSVVHRQPNTNMDVMRSQPHEILSHIFAFVQPTDLACLSRTCRYLHSSIADDDLLWRDQYLRKFDEPFPAPQSWRNALQHLIKFQKLLESEDTAVKDDQLKFVGNTAISLLEDVSKPHQELNRKFLGQYFSSVEGNRKNISSFLSRSSLFSRAGLPTDFPADTSELRQMSAKLHVYYGLEIEPTTLELVENEDIDDDGVAVAHEVHPCARSRVYDLRTYKSKNFWGPFMDDGSGRVDWEKAQSIMIVLAHGLRIFTERTNGEVGPFWDEPFVGLAANSFRSRSFEKTIQEKDLFPGQDPYGVRGTWMRVVNFLDYHDLFAFNFQPPLIPADQERHPIWTKEAFRLILLKLTVTKIEQPSEDDQDTDPSMPIVHFEGVSKSLHMRWDPNANSQIRGTVRTTRHGDVRWTTFSVFHGEERWRSEGIQIGGINSGRGILGNWFDKDYDAHGPAGPTAFWKISDEFAATKLT